MTSVLLTGATGLVGTRLIPLLEARDHDVRWLSRRAGKDPRGLVWNGREPPAGAVADATAVVHLAGKPIFGGLPTAAQRREIFDSRVESTRGIVDAMAALPEAQRPEFFLCASAVGYYRDGGDDPLSEEAPPGDDFTSELCCAWEQEALRAEALGIRTVRLRIGVVLAGEGGALATMRIPFMLGLGGPLGSGEQWFPWIHIDDLCAVIRNAVEDPRYRGAINAVAPNPVRNAELTRALAGELHRPAFLRVPAFALRALLGPLAGELLGSRRVVPTRLSELDFAHAYPTLEGALAAELGPDRD
ncbi:MAG: TIGR01777 family protein [Myxococcales bacterium]|nr:TIGR01777 family protein [Myxococcales bacterium]